MDNLTFFEKIEYLWNTIINNKEIKYIIPFLLIIILIVVVSFFFRKKKMNSIYLTLYLIMIGTLFFVYHNPIINMLTMLFQSFIDYLLFPNLFLYLILIITANIVLISVVINNNLNKFVKAVNIILFSFMQVLLFFIIKHIVGNNIDITTKLTMDNYPQLLVLVETSIFIFALWGLFLLVTKLINGIKDYREVKEMESEYNLSLEEDDVYTNDDLVEYVPIKKVQ